MIEFESDQFQAVGHSWKMIIEVKDAQSEDPELCFYLRLCNPSSRNTFYNKVIFNTFSIVWSISGGFPCNKLTHDSLAYHTKSLDSRIHSIGLQLTAISAPDKWVFHMFQQLTFFRPQGRYQLRFERGVALLSSFPVQARLTHNFTLIILTKYTIFTFQSSGYLVSNILRLQR